MATEDDDGFGYGEWVEFKLNTDFFGIVVGSDALGLVYQVQLAGSGQIAPFHGAVLRSIDVDSDEYVDPDPSQSADVIDFTKARDLRAAKTRGAA